MQILLRTDSNIVGSDQLKQEVESTVQAALRRFGRPITRVEVFLSDENSRHKPGERDKRCVLEAHVGGLEPVTVSHLGATLDQAVEGAADKLEKTLRRTIGRKSALCQRRARTRAALNAADSVLKREVEAGRHEEFKQVLRPLLAHLDQLARREIRTLEATGTLEPGQVIASELVNEVVARAWLQFSERPAGLALDLWLTKLLDEVLEQQVQRSERTAASLDQPAEETSPKEVPQIGEQQWWVWLLGGDEEPEAEEHEIASRQSMWAEEFLEAEELMERIFSILGELPRLQRQAFVLNVLEGYDLFEVAMVQSRPEEEIKADIEAARRHLSERLQAGTQEEEFTEAGAYAAAGSQRPG